MRIFKLDGFTVFLAVLFAAGAALVLAREATFGVGLTVDSAAYVVYARHLIEGKGFTFQDGGFLFPLLLAFAGSVFNVDPIDAAGYVNAAAFGLIICVTTAWIRRRVQSRALVAWAGVACALSLPLANASAMAMTEALFILLATLSLFALDGFLKTDRRAMLLVSAGSAGLAWATRYNGAVLAASALLTLMLQRKEAFSGRLKRSALYFAVAASLVGASMVRNFLATGLPAGHRHPNGFSPAISFGNVVDEFMQWVFGELVFRYLNSYLVGASGVGVSLVKLGVLLALAAALGRSVRRSASGRMPAGMAVPMAFVSAYALSLVTVHPLVDIRIYWRFLTPMYVPMLVAVTLALDARLRRAAEEWPLVSVPVRGKAMTASAFALTLTIGLVFWTAQNVVANYQDMRLWTTEGVARYSTRAWAESDVIRYLNVNRPSGGVWSTDSRGVNLLIDYPHSAHADGLPARLLGAEDFWVGPARRDGVDSTYFVWFHDRHFVPYEYGLEELGALPGVETAAAFDDGVIFEASLAAYGRRLFEMFTEASIEQPAPVESAAFDFHFDENISAPEYEISRVGDEVAYSRDGKCEGDGDDRFFLHVYPVDASDLPEVRRQHGFDNLDFEFRHQPGVDAAGRCVVRRALPGYGIRRIRTGMVGQDWLAESAEELDAYSLEKMLVYTRSAPIEYAISRVGDAVAYSRDGKCEGDGGDRFFLHVYPVDASDLPEVRRQRGFDALDFEFRHQSGVDAAGRCVVRRALPGYGIRRIRTGVVGQDWFAESAAELDVYSFEKMLTYVTSAPMKYRISRVGDAVAYSRDGKCEGDGGDRFFLHVYPVDASDLPEVRRQHGFDALDFDFRHQLGVDAAGRCVALRALPGYDIRRIRTGVVGQDWFASIVGRGAPQYGKDADIFLRVYPIDADDLHENHKQQGFEELDFNFLQHGGESEGRFIAMRELPQYDIQRIETGQRRDGEVVWRASFSPD